ncbi:MAG: STAS domain-containing protein [Sedimentisphaerales bacterium]|nr:STAS domain-containing protein [Sedimentisphaerales bacterium]
MSNLNLDISERNNTIIITLSGSADMAQAGDLKSKLEKTPLTDKNVIIDMGSLEFIASMGLGGLIFIHQLCLQQKTSFKLVNPQGAVAKVLKTTQLDQLFDIYSSIDEALAEL